MNDINIEWFELNNQIKEVSSDKTSDWREIHDKCVELIKQKSKIWNRNIKMGFILDETGSWIWNCPAEFDHMNITSWEDDCRKFITYQTNNFPVSKDDPILEIPVPKRSNEVMIGDIVNVRFIDGTWGRSKAIDIIEGEPSVVVSREIQTGCDHRGYIVDYEFRDGEYFEKKWEDKWERQFDDELI